MEQKCGSFRDCSEDLSLVIRDGFDSTLSMTLYIFSNIYKYRLVNDWLLFLFQSVVFVSLSVNFYREKLLVI